MIYICNIKAIIIICGCSRIFTIST